MAAHGKKYRNVAEKVNKDDDYSVVDAIAFLKENPTANFDETFEMAFRMGVEVRLGVSNRKGERYRNAHAKRLVGDQTLDLSTIVSAAFGAAGEGAGRTADQPKTECAERYQGSSVKVRGYRHRGPPG